MLFTGKNPFRQLKAPALLMLATILFGVAGYMLTEGYDFLDALYMTVITISTVGFEVVRPLTVSGKIFTIILILFNLALVAYFISLVTRFLIDGEFIKKYKLQKMEHKINELRGHVIVCGYGRNGKESALILKNNNIPFVVVENRPADDTEAALVPTQFFIHGNATQDDVLIAAGIHHAKAVITTLPVDSDNLFLVLSARQLNPAIKIISRASVDSSVHKLKIAGADNVIMPDKIGGAHMATLVLQPDVTEILSIMGTTSNPSFRIVELTVGKAMLLSELDLWRNAQCTVIGVKDIKKHYTVNPPPAYQLAPGVCLIVMGSDAQIDAARKLLS